MMRWHRTVRLAAVAAVLMLPGAAFAQEDAGVGAPTFKEGDTISFDKIDSLKNFLPAEFWANRDFFFYEGMKMEIGPFHADYAPPPEFTAGSPHSSPGSSATVSKRQTTSPVSASRACSTPRSPPV